MAEPVKHNYQQRRIGHDYTSRCMYLITVNTTDRKPILGSLVGQSATEAEVVATPVGKAVIAAFYNIEKIVKAKTGCEVQIVQYQLMPEHFHGIIYIKETLPPSMPLGKIIGAWKGECSRAYWREMEKAELTSRQGDVLRGTELTSRQGDVLRGGGEKRPLFEAGFNDRPLSGQDQLKRWIAYLNDNPRRRWIKHHFPNRLRKVHQFRVGKSNHPYTAVGETLLVTYPERVQVRCHRNLTDEQIREEVAYYMDLAHQGKVLVSPFISPAEKAVYDACSAEQLPMIRIIKRALDGKFTYPSGRDFDGCVSGFLLVMAPYEEGDPEAAARAITREGCLSLNDFAADLCTEDHKGRS